MTRSTKVFLVLALLILVAGALLIGLSRLAGDFTRVPSRAVLEIRLDGPIPEDDPGAELNRLFGIEVVTLSELVEGLDRAASDERIAALQLRVGFLGAGWGRTQELRDAVERFRASGKPLQALLEYGDDQSYYLASAASDLRMVRTGTLWLDGLSAEVGFYGGPLDKLGVRADFEQIGEYKNAADVLERREMSPAHRESMESLIGGLFDELVDGVARGRGLEAERARALISQGPFSPAQAMAAGLIDAISFPDEADEALAGELGVDELETVEIRDYVRSGGRSKGPRVAVVHCIGPITPGESTQSVFGGRTMGSDTITEAIRKAWEDDGARAIILRVDSPGGSPLASDLIWRAAEQAQAAGVPVVVSMADVAASGGYWIAMGADRVLAQPATITGSIGIYGGKYVFRDLHDKIDYNVEAIERGDHAGWFSPRRPFTPEERSLLRDQLAETYSLFIEKVAEGRGFETPDEVDAIARGRVWTGRQALENGLVDRLGGLDVAVEEVRELTGLEPGEPVRLESYPRPPTLSEMFFGDGAQARERLARELAAEALGGLPAPLRELAATAPALQLLAGERVLALLPWQLRIR